MGAICLKETPAVRFNIKYACLKQIVFSQNI